MSLAYRVPPSRIKKRLTSEDVSVLMAAYRAGLLPDPWLQTATLAAVIANRHRGKSERAYEPSEFLPGRRKLSMSKEELWQLSETSRRS